METVQLLIGLSVCSNVSLMVTVSPLIKNVCKNNIGRNSVGQVGVFVCTQERGGLMIPEEIDITNLN